MEQRSHDIFRIDPSGQDIPGDAARMRKRGEVVEVELRGGIRAWAPTRHRILKELLNHPLVSRDARQHWPHFDDGWLDEHPEAGWIRSWIGVDNMLTAFGSDHQRLRALIAPSFSARRTKAMTPTVTRIAQEMLDDLARHPTGRTVDLRAEFCQRLPLRVISALFGLDREEGERLAELTTQMNSTVIPPEQGMAAFLAVRSLLAALVTRKREAPGIDFTSSLIAARDGADRLTEEELIDTLLVTLTAGFETTVNLIGNAVVALLRHRDQLSLVLAGQVPWADVVEEVLRWAPPVAYLPLRFSTADLTVGGVLIRKGEAILASFGAVGWDPDEHGPEADRFDIRRRPARHLAFGDGVHHCIAAPLARSEALTALPALFARFPHIDLAPDRPLEPFPNFIAHGWNGPHVILTV